MWERARNFRVVCSVLIGLATTAALVPPCRAAQGQAGREETLRLRETVAALQEQVAALKARAAAMEAEIAALRARLDDGDQPPPDVSEAGLLLRDLHGRLSRPGALPGLVLAGTPLFAADANPYFGYDVELMEELGEVLAAALAASGLVFGQQQVEGALVVGTEFILAVELKDPQADEFIVIGWAFRDDEAAAAAMEILLEQWAHEDLQLSTRRWGDAVILCAAESEDAPPARFDELSKAVWAMVDVGPEPAAGVEFAPEGLGPEAAAGVELLRALYEEHLAGDAFEGLELMPVIEIGVPQNPYFGDGRELAEEAARELAGDLAREGYAEAGTILAEALREDLAATFVCGYQTPQPEWLFMLVGWAFGSPGKAAEVADALPLRRDEGRWINLRKGSVVLMGIGETQMRWTAM